ncbi:CpsD/CapB family tyrosine-protein kinase [bacterium]|nr:CpsD/CapB family tyrosine-protein kinase [bacterium]
MAESPLLVESQPENPWSRKVYAFRNHLLQELRLGNRCIMLCSCWQGDGKSSLAANLAATLAQMAFRTVLVDGDLSKPTLTTLFGLESTPGLLDCLQGRPAKPIKLDQHNFYLLPQGQSAPGVRQAIRNDEVSRLFSELKAAYDSILVDTTALSLNSDALSLGTGVDGCYLIVRAGKFQGVPEGHFIEDLRDAKISVLGTLVNG